MKIELRAVEGVRAYEQNPRVYGEAIGAVAASIRQFGFRQPIVIDAEGVIVCGHVRYYAARELGLDRVPVHVADDLSAEQIRAYRLADNKTAELAEWDLEKLAIEVGDLQACNFELGLLGFDAGELEELLNAGLKEGATDPDEIPAPPAEPITERGDLWILGEHRLLCGDSANREHLLRLVGDERIHLVNTDPPYNVKVEPRSNNAIAAGLSSFGATHHQQLDVARHPKKKKATDRELRAKDRPLANDFLDEKAFERCLDGWFGNLAHVLIPGGAFYIWGGYANLANYPPALKTHELYFSQALIWVKEHPVLTRKDFMGNHEWCFYGWRAGAGHRYFGPANAVDVWELTRSSALGAVGIGNGVRICAEDGSRIDVMPPGEKARAREVVAAADGILLYGANNATDVWRVKKVNPQSMVHLTEKPVELAVRAMQYSSRAGENVLDLFGGSGSTLIAAEQTGRRAFLMELDPLYADVIVTRWERFTGRKASRIAAGANLPK